MKAAKILVIVLFCALIRCIAEPFRLYYKVDHSISFYELQPLLIGAAICSVALLANTLFLYYKKHIPVIVISILALVALVVIKLVMM